MLSWESHQLFLFWVKMDLSIYFWLRWVFFIARGLSPVVDSKDYSLVVVCGFLIAVASLVVEHGL